MRLVLTALIFASGLFFILFGLGFLLQPVETAATLGLAATNPLGSATLRADLLSFFGIAGICMMWGAWKRSGDILLVPAIMMGLAIIGRLVSAATDGAFVGFYRPILVEAAIFILLMIARNLLPHHRVQEVGE